MAGLQVERLDHGGSRSERNGALVIKPHRRMRDGDTGHLWQKSPIPSLPSESIEKDR